MSEIKYIKLVWGRSKIADLRIARKDATLEKLVRIPAMSEKEILSV